jgi:hypothetical protein
MTDSDKPAGSEREAQRVEELARELAEQLRAMENRQELTDYAVSLLRDSAEEAHHAEQARESVEKAASSEAFNPIAFGIPLLVVGAVLCATGILSGPGLGIIAIAALMVVWGLVVAIFGPRKTRGPGA